MSTAGRLHWPLLLACTLLLPGLGCGRDEERGPSSITVSYPGDERVFGPYWDMPAKFLLFLPLVSLDEDGKLEGRLARRWEHSGDFRTWTIHLRTDVRWHDGVPVMAHDVKFTHDLFAHPDVLWDPPGAATVEVLDDSTYRVAYRQSLANPLSTWRVYYPKHLLEKLEPKEFARWDFWTRPVGNGPYRYARHIPQTFIEVEADPNYFGEKPKIQRVILKLTSNTGLTDLLSGEVDAAAYLSSTEKLKVASDPQFAVYHEVYGAQLRDIGVRMDLQPVERFAGFDRLNTGKFEAIMTLFIHHSGRLGTYFGERARFGYRNPRLTRLIELARTTADPQAVDHAYREMSDILRTDQPVAFLLLDSTTHIVHRRVKGLSAPWRADPLLFMEDLWLEEEP